MNKREALLAHKEINIFDIKHLNDLAHDYKQQIKALIALYRAIEAAQARQHLDNKIAAFPAIHRNVITARHQIAALWQLYRMAYADSYALTAEYTRRLRHGNWHQTPDYVANDYRSVA